MSDLELDAYRLTTVAPDLPLIEQLQRIWEVRQRRVDELKHEVFRLTKTIPGELLIDGLQRLLDSYVPLNEMVRILATPTYRPPNGPEEEARWTELRASCEELRQWLARQPQEGLASSDPATLAR